MKCIFCEKDVVAREPVTVPGLGPAHRTCYEQELLYQGVFKGLSLKSLTDVEISELSDMLKMEVNSRRKDNDVSLF